MHVKLRLGSMLLQLKLTLLFMLFGLIIGYSSYFVTSISNTKMVVDQFLSTNKNPIYNLNKNLSNDWMLKLGDINEKDNNRVILQSLIPTEFKDSIVLEFYYKNAARIVAIADVWDAITADRPYRKGFTQAKAMEIMKSEKGKLFDPALLDIFIQGQ